MKIQSEREGERKRKIETTKTSTGEKKRSEIFCVYVECVCAVPCAVSCTQWENEQEREVDVGKNDYFFLELGKKR